MYSHYNYSKNPATTQSYIHYRLQLIFQVWFHLFKLVNFQPMFQFCTQSVDQVMGFFIFQSSILASTLVYQCHKPHIILSVFI